MSKSERLMQTYGGAIQETVGRRSASAPVSVGGEGAATGDKYSGATRSRAFAEMPVAAIGRGMQPRTEFDEEAIARLAESIKRFGQLAPIRVRLDQATGNWVVLVGERRLLVLAKVR